MTKKKTLHLVRPEEMVCFLDEGRGQKVRYLKIPRESGFDWLKEDVTAGAKHMEKLLKLTERCGTGLSRVIVLRGTNEETLLLGGTYLAMECNKNAIINSYDYEEDDMDYTEAKYRFEEADDELTAGDNDEDEGAPSEYRESAFKLPLIEMEELAMHSCENNWNVFGDEFLSVGSQQIKNTKPYWMGCRKEPVAILIRKNPFYCGDYNYGKLLERFEYNRNVFLFILEEENELGFSFEAGEELKEGIKNAWEEKIQQLVLENVADMVWIGADVKSNVKYHCLVFENLIEQLGYRLADKFPVRELVKKITLLQNPRKAELMEKVICYVAKERRKASTIPLTEVDFRVLNDFGFLSEEKDGKQKNVLEQMEKELVGMESVKQQIRSIVQTMKYVKYREKNGFGKCNIHNVYLLIGAPGTAKSSVAKLLGQALFQERLLPGKRFISINGADLKAKYVGQTASRVKALFEQFDVIMIDEAYSLTAKHGEEMDSFGQEALAQIILEVEERTNKVVLFAGYGGIGISEKDNKMKAFLDANPGLKSRVNSTIFFDSYSPEEMVQIVHSQAKLQKLNVSHEADEQIQAYFEKRAMASDFGNGREARSLVENAFRCSAERVMAVPESKRTKKMMSELTAADIRKAIASLSEGNLMQQGRQRIVCGF